MSPARAAPGWSPPRAVLAGRVLQLARSAPLYEARAAALIEAEVGRPRAESSRPADDADAQLKSVPGQPPGQPHPTYIRPRRPRASPTRPRPSGDLSAAPATAPGAVKAHLYRGNPSGRLLE